MRFLTLCIACLAISGCTTPSSIDNCTRNPLTITHCVFVKPVEYVADGFSSKKSNGVQQTYDHSVSSGSGSSYSGAAASPVPVKKPNIGAPPKTWGE